MPSWDEVLSELRQESAQSNIDKIRRKYLKELFNKIGRNIITYYSGWLQKPGVRSAYIDDSDMNGFMNAIYKLNKSKGLDLILHTPGGELTATESIVQYLRRIFGNNIRIIIPHLALSAGTMIALSGKEILMGKHSYIGPIDPQFGGISAEGVIEEFERAKSEIKKDQSSIPLWQTIISKYHPTFIGDCEKAIAISKNIVRKWLETGMFENEENIEKKINNIIEKLSHSETGTHARHIGVEICEDELQLKIVRLEALGNELQDLILTVHHAYMHTFSTTSAIKIIENHNGKALVTLHNPVKK